MAHGFTPLFSVSPPTYTATVEETGPNNELEADLAIVSGFGQEKNKPKVVVQVKDPQSVILDTCNRVMETILRRVEPELHHLLVEKYAVPPQV